MSTPIKTGFGSGSYSLSDIVDDLKERFFNLDQVADSKKIIFVCHSMGGIVVRKFIVERLYDLLDRHIGIGIDLVASPSLSSGYADWLEPIARFAGQGASPASSPIVCYKLAILMAPKPKLGIQI